MFNAAKLRFDDIFENRLSQEEVREYLKKQFQRIEIYTFNDLMFDCKGQDTIVLIAYKEHHEKGEFFTNIEFNEELILLLLVLEGKLSFISAISNGRLLSENEICLLLSKLTDFSFL